MSKFIHKVALHYTFFSFYNIFLATCLRCTRFFLLFVQMNLGGDVQLVIANVLKNLFLPLVFRNLNDNHVWNWKVDEYIAMIFDFAKKFLASNGVVLLFHRNDLRVLKEVKSYLESYGFQIQMKWVVVNLLPFKSNEDPSFKDPSQSIKLSLYFFSFFL